MEWLHGWTVGLSHTNNSTDGALRGTPPTVSESSTGARDAFCSLDNEPSIVRPASTCIHPGCPPRCSCPSSRFPPCASSPRAQLIPSTQPQTRSKSKNPSPPNPKCQLLCHTPNSTPGASLPTRLTISVQAPLIPLNGIWHNIAGPVSTCVPQRLITCKFRPSSFSQMEREYRHG